MQPLNLGRQSLDDGLKNNNRGVRIELSLFAADGAQLEKPGR
jgi:hypothetical protein